MEHFEERLQMLKDKFNLSDEATIEVKQLCCAHAINCSMDQMLLEQTSAYIVQRIFDTLNPYISAAEQQVNETARV